MSNSLTVHFHLKHYKESGLPFCHYMLLLCYENREDWQVKDFSELLSLSDRTITRMRVNLTEKGFLKKEKDRYSLTNKLYEDKNNNCV